MRSHLLSFALLFLLLPACGNYSAQVVNHSQRPIYAAMFGQSKDGTRLLASAPLQPDTEATLGPANFDPPPTPSANTNASTAVGGGGVFIIIDTSPNPRSPRRLPLTKGTQARFEVTQFMGPDGTIDPKAPIQVNQVR